tara:strand:- start:716 stop:1150 length:435 start_codon:yes stop_codon:yes gene_type:complete
MEQLQLDLGEPEGSPNLDALTAMYIKIRDVVRDKEEKHAEDMQELKEHLDAVSARLLAVCNEQNADSIRTSSGTISRRIQSRYWTTDWESMYAFIEEHAAPFLLEKRIHNGNMKEFLEGNPDVLPIGLQAERKFIIQVRKPNAK